MVCKHCGGSGQIATPDHQGVECPFCTARSARTGYVYTPPQKGCVCPPGANKDCRAWDCPRNAAAPFGMPKVST